MGLDADQVESVRSIRRPPHANDVIEKLADQPGHPQSTEPCLRHPSRQRRAGRFRAVRLKPPAREPAPGRPYPMTLFKQMVTEGVLELAPDLTGEGKRCTLAFQAYSEHHLARRLLESITSDDTAASKCTEPRLAALARRLDGDAWLWRAFAVVLPEEEGVELVDLLPAGSPMSRRLHGAMFDSYADRATESFTERTRQLFDQQCSLSNPEGIDTRISTGTRIGHTANADWLQQQLSALPLSDRDATWTIGAFDAHEESAAYLRLKTWAAAWSPTRPQPKRSDSRRWFTWLVTSSNRYLRDDASKTLALLLSKRLDVVPDLFTAARGADDPYVQERALTCAYGAVIAGGDAQPQAVTNIWAPPRHWLANGLPVHVLDATPRSESPQAPLAVTSLTRQRSTRSGRPTGRHPLGNRRRLRSWRRPTG